MTECFNDTNKLINFYFNKEKKQYEPCFETCNTCEYGGNEEINNCTSCDIGSIFRPEINGTKNCVKKCKYKYYYTSYGQYKCSETENCPKEANLFVPNKNKCIKDCKLDDKYKFQYSGECIEECPNNTKEENNICKYIYNDKCSFTQKETFLKDYNLNNDELDLLVKTYSKEYTYTNNHILIYKNEYYSITIYKNKECINELSLKVPQIDFNSCYNDIKLKNSINSDLLILIYERYKNESSSIFYNFYEPIN